ncbi:MAG: V-type ATP synthase subunit E [Candidatus Krumholzibacteria bacterium]|nr:V-type ATP synthase subunit E [Candidatus Krumholzibacteria bacterium]
MSIENILKRIDEETQTAAAEMMSNGEAKAAGVRDEYAKQGSKIRAELENRARVRAADEERRLIVGEELELRKAFLVRKREILDEIYGEARKRIVGLPAAGYLELVKALILANAQSGREEIVVSGAQRDILSREFIEALNEIKGAGAAFSLAETPGDFAWGVVLREGQRSVDLTLDVLFDQLKTSVESEIASVLFPE